MMRRARRKYDEEPDNQDRWLISYADFITLLFAFFVVMYAISQVNEGKYRVFQNAIGQAFSLEKGAPPIIMEAPQAIPLPNPALKRRTEAIRREREHMTRLAQDLTSTLAPLVREGKVRVTQTSRGVSVEINASVLFDPGAAGLTMESDQALRAVAVLLKDDTHDVQVEGHTDVQPISNSTFASNWELSAARASAVVRLFIASGVKASRLTAVGHADNIPVAPNETAEGRARNRRVAVTILSGIPETVTEVPTAPMRLRLRRPFERRRLVQSRLLPLYLFIMKSSSLGSLVYSTETGRMCPACRQPLTQCACKAQAKAVPAGDGVVRVSRQTKGRGGKSVTVVKGLALDAIALALLGKQLRTQCGSGGTVKDGVIEVQGDHVETVMAALLKLGHQPKKASG